MSSQCRSLVKDINFHEIGGAGAHDSCEEPALSARQSSTEHPGLKKALFVAFLGISALACALIHQRGRRASIGHGLGSMIALDSVDSTQLYEGAQHGKGRHMVESKHDKGICGFQKKPARMKSVAVSQEDSGGVRSCGMCIKAWSEDGDTISAAGEFFFVSNICQVCKKGDLGLTINATIAKNISVTWQAVPCPVGDHSIQYKLEGSSKYYVKIRPFEARLPIEKMELKDGTKWVESTLPDYGYYFESRSENGGFSFPLQVRLTAITGEVLKDSITELSEDVQRGGGSVQFRKPAFAPPVSPMVVGDGSSQNSSASSSSPLLLLVGFALAMLSRHA